MMAMIPRWRFSMTSVRPWNTCSVTVMHCFCNTDHENSKNMHGLPLPMYPIRDNRPSVDYTDLPKIAMKLYSAGIDKVRADSMIRNALIYDKETGRLQIQCMDFVLHKKLEAEFFLNHNVYVVGMGKAIANMCRATNDLIGEHIVDGIAVLTDEQASDQGLARELDKFQLVGGGDGRYPSEQSYQAALKIEKLCNHLRGNDILITLLSGGGSSLVCYPRPPITVQDKAETTRVLENAGGSSIDLNRIRKNLSMIKAGGLAAMASPAQVINLTLSNLPHNDASEVASGPTAPDYTTVHQCLELFRKYKIQDKIPAAVRKLLEGEALERGRSRIKLGTKSYANLLQGPQPRYNTSNAINIMAGSDQIAVDEILNVCADCDIPAVHMVAPDRQVRSTTETGRLFGAMANYISGLLTRTVGSTSRELVASELQCIAAGMDKSSLVNVISVCTAAVSKKKPVCLIFTSEIRSRIIGNGIGGPCQEAALATAIELAEIHKTSTFLENCDVQLVSIDSDGEDGSTPVSGAIANRFQTAGLVNGRTAQEYLKNNDSYTFYANLENGRYHVFTGKTGTDIQNFQLLLVRKQ